MFWFSSCLRFLVVVMSTVVAVAEIEEQFVPEGEESSCLFSDCIEKNTIDGSLYSISVKEDIEYVKFDATGSYQTIEWDSQADISGTIECAFRAHEEGAPMFKFTRSEGCQLAHDNVYDRSQPSCGDSEIVYITNATLGVADGNRKRQDTWSDTEVCTDCEPGPDDPRQTICEVNDVMTLLSYPPEPLDCCPTSEANCLAVSSQMPHSWCSAVNFCRAFGLVNAHVGSSSLAHQVFGLMARIFSYKPEYETAWVDVFRDNEGVWRHGSTREAVDTSLWGPGEPSDVGNCAVATAEGFIQAEKCEADHNMLCQAPVENYPTCANTYDAFLTGY
ncbi:C-type lectin-like [Trinorchestia longiramus]|nr:C-type lectin-like [Trinorchestia longiramus]